MSTAIAFDTYAYVRRLRDAGVDEAQAAIQADTLVTLVEDRLATKQDVADLKRDIALIEANLKRDIKEMDVRIVNVESNLKKDIAILNGKIEITKAELRKDIETAKVDIIKWVVVTGIAILGGVAALIRFAPTGPAYYQPPTQEMRQMAPVPVPSPALPTPSAPTH
ncbi:MAG: DUF1640 domain-containing protein [Magnetococcales bacterium]|nr:DUF1640 domain-containing protein [Magnetococcales bacterium]